MKPVEHADLTVKLPTKTRKPVGKTNGMTHVSQLIEATNSVDDNPFFGSPSNMVAGDGGLAAGNGVVCKPFDYTSAIPPRMIIEINHCKSYALGFISLTGAAGGTGKSSLAIVEELSLALGVDLFHPERKPLKCGRMKVWSMSLEDDETEHRRRVLAAIKFYNINPVDLAGYYFVTYKADSPIEIGIVSREIGFIATPQVEQIKSTIAKHGINVINVDPFVNTHGVPENDNGAINKVADLWRGIAQETITAIGLAHHLRKAGGAEVTSSDLRGAGALEAAARLVRVLAPMSADDAKRAKIEEERRRFYFWVNPSAKANIVPPATKRSWYHLASVDLENAKDLWESDSIGVVERWDVPDSMDSVTGLHVQKLAALLQGVDDTYLAEHCRDSSASPKWIGNLIAEIMDVDISDPGERNAVKQIIKGWVASGVLIPTKIPDASRQLRGCFALGSAAQMSSFEEPF
jgi:hypothetical protein